MISCIDDPEYDDCVHYINDSSDTLIVDIYKGQWVSYCVCPFDTLHYANYPGFDGDTFYFRQGDIELRFHSNGMNCGQFYSKKNYSTNNDNVHNIYSFINHESFEYLAAGLRRDSLLEFYKFKEYVFPENESLINK